MTAVLPPPHTAVEDVLRRALDEDLGRAGDLTTNSTIPVDHRTTGRVVARAAGTIAGLDASLGVFALLAPDVTVTTHVSDGEAIAAGTVLADVSGPTRALLTGERTCLNLLGQLSGIATATADMVGRVVGTNAVVADTRKTTPGLRALEKYAVRCGGGRNHRFGLDDAILIKDNHIAAIGSLTETVRAARAAVGHLVKIEVEVDTLDQLDEALEAGVDVVLLDNMSNEQLVTAVATVDGRCVTEASGGVSPETIAAIAATGVDVISTGWLTHSAPQLDVALDV